MSKRRLSLVLSLVLVLLLLATTTAGAQAEEPPATIDLAAAINTAWMLIAAFLVFFMQAGFGFLEAGFVRSKNVVNFIVGLFIYPVVGHWIWGPDGWLASLGMLDFAGSTACSVPWLSACGRWRVASSMAAGGASSVSRHWVWV